MEWCCDYLESRFQSRLDYGEFVAAGLDPRKGDVVFFGGFNMCHRRDYLDVISATRLAALALEKVGISNFKLTEHSVLHYCKICGANLRKHYGDDGGLLRDDEYVSKLLEGLP
jgi:hypothetical protein